MFHGWVEPQVDVDSAGIPSVLLTLWMLHMRLTLRFANRSVYKKLRSLLRQRRHLRSTYAHFSVFSYFSLVFSPTRLLFRSSRYSIRRRPSENSKQFKLCFFRFFDFLVCDLVKRRHRTIVKERAARQAAEQQQQSSSSSNRSSTGGGGAANSTMRGRGASFERLKTQHTPPPPPPPPPARGGSNSGSSHAGMPAAVKG